MEYMDIGNAGDELFSSGASTVEPCRRAPVDRQDSRLAGAENASKRSQRVALVARTSLPLFASFALALSAAHAQVPKPPVLVGGTGPATGNILFRETFDGFDLARVPAEVPNAWGRALPCAGCSGTNLVVANTDPVASGLGKYLHPYAKKQGTDVYRTELTYIGTPYTHPRVSLVDVGSDGAGGRHYASAQDFWYGYYLCLDQYTGAGTEHIHFSQWHDDAPVYSGEAAPLGYIDANPAVSLFGNSYDLVVYIEHSEEPDGADGDTSVPGNQVVSPVLETNPVGKCRAVIFNIRQDSRTRAQGGKGTVRIFLGSDPNPKWAWVNRQVGHPSSVGGNSYAFYFAIGGYESSWRWWGTEGQEYSARYDNFTVMDSSGSWAAMYDAVTTP